LTNKLNLKPILLSDKQLFEEYLGINNYIQSEYSFVTWFSWQGLCAYRHAVIENCLCVFGITRDTNTGFALFPLGADEDIKKALLFLISHFDGKGKRLNLICVSAQMLQTLERIGLSNLFSAELEQNRADYICKRENFTLLQSKKLHSKRNHYNYFSSTYDARLTPITDGCVPECQKMIAEIIEDRSASPNAELSVTNVILKNRDALGLKGGVLHADNHPIGVILGEGRGNDAIIHIAKADVNYRGSSVALFKLFLDENFTGCQYINLMDDMGMEGLRRAKTAWRPEFMAEYYNLTFFE
jgi:hypothetical protein